jgi:hypothetical protein
MELTRHPVPENGLVVMDEDGSMTVWHNPMDGFLGPFVGSSRPSGDPDARVAPGRFTQFMEYMMVHRERNPGEVAIEYSKPINFLEDGVDMPSTWNSSEKQKD